MDMEEINWRGWQKDLREYLDKPCNRKIIWVVGKRGNEGKSFFQRNVREEFGYSRVSTLELGETARNTFHILGKLNSTNTNIFLFNVPRRGYLSNEQYKILESIKDGSATSGKYNGRVLNFKRPNVMIVFANREPDREELSQDRWKILKISPDLTELSDITHDKYSVKKKTFIENDESEYGRFTDDCF